MVTFLDHDVGDPRLVLLLQADAGLSDGQQLIVQHLQRNRESWEILTDCDYHLSLLTKF